MRGYSQVAGQLMVSSQITAMDFYKAMNVKDKKFYRAFSAEAGKGWFRGSNCRFHDTTPKSTTVAAEMSAGLGGRLLPRKVGP